MQDIHASKVLILDFGSQYTQLIARRVREMHVYCEIHPFDLPAEQIQQFKPSAIILSGGPDSVDDVTVLRPSAVIFNLQIPVLGICYGMQIMARELGGKVEAASVREFAAAEIRARGHSILLRDIQDRSNAAGHGLLDVWMSHSDEVTQLPAGFQCIAESPNTPLAGIADEARRLYGLQFHPEVTHTRQGTRILQRFLFAIAECKPAWTTENIIQESISSIRNMVGNTQVLLALSGGVDSSVLATLLHKAIGEQLICVFVDNGLLRAREGDMLMQIFHEQMGIHVQRIDAETEFLNALSGVIDPEQKRKIIGRTFIQIFEREAQGYKDVAWLAQGTIYPDVIESAAAKTGKSALIKSHHNVGGLPADMHLALLEPFRELFKDEVRAIGRTLGISSDIINRHPFPGPGLAVRILGEVSNDNLRLLRAADSIFIEELKSHGWYEKVAQAFVVFLPVRSVSVMGDNRRHDYVVSLRAVETIDFMTANWAHLPHDFLDKVALRIINEVDGISRVTYDISNKPPATIEWE